MDVKCDMYFLNSPQNQFKKIFVNVYMQYIVDDDGDDSGDDMSGINQMFKVSTYWDFK